MCWGDDWGGTFYKKGTQKIGCRGQNALVERVDEKGGIPTLPTPHIKPGFSDYRLGLGLQMRYAFPRINLLMPTMWCRGAVVFFH